jgi:tetratricopeptide (TPR) repeat protein
LVLRAQERYEEAAECFERALELDPKYAAAKKALRDVRRALRFLLKGTPRKRGRPPIIPPLPEKSRSESPGAPGLAAAM